MVEKIQTLFRSGGAKTSAAEDILSAVREVGAPAIPVDYRLQHSGNGWKVYDVSIDGISLVSNYRSSFANQIRRYKIDGLIAKLEKLNQRGG